MKNKPALILIVLLAVSFLFASCSDDPVATQKTRRDILLSHSWTFQRALRAVSGEDASDVIGIDAVTFHSDGRAESKKEGTTIGTTVWQLTNGDRTLVIDGDSCEVRTLTDEKLTFRVLLYDYKEDKDTDADLYFVK